MEGDAAVGGGVVLRVARLTLVVARLTLVVVL